MSFAFAASVTVLGVKPIATVFPLRILCFLRFLLFQAETNTMHPLFAKADRLSGEVIGAAIEVHRIMGTGLLELSYMKLLNVPLGFLFNFHEVKLVQGNSREGGPIGASDARSHLFLPDSGATEKTAQHQNWRIGLV